MSWNTAPWAAVLKRDSCNKGRDWSHELTPMSDQLLVLLYGADFCQ